MGFKEHILNRNNDTNEDEFIIKGREPVYTPESAGMGYAYYKYMKKHKHAIAQRDGITGIKDTYGNLLKRCIRTAIEMRARGINKHDIVTICTRNHLNSCVPVIASLFLGARMACLDPMLSIKDTVFLIKQARPKMAFVGLESVELIEKSLEEAELDIEIVVFGISEVHSEFADFFAPKTNDDFKPVEIKNNKDTALILFSSGSTGLPKGICISHYALLAQAYNCIDAGYTFDCLLLYASFYWISTNLLGLACTIAGGCRLILPSYNPAQFWKLLDQFKVTLAFTAPSQVTAMYNKGRPDGIDTSNLKVMIIGGGPLAGEHIVKARKLFPDTLVVLIYGQTEVAGTGLYFRSNSKKDIIASNEKPDSSGKPVPGMECKIVDPETEQDLGPNQRGELRIRCDYELNGYYHKETSDVWDANGWLKTGDVAYYDEDGYFFIVDRIKEMLKFQSYHVAPAAIEGVLLHHPSIAAAVVIGIPHVEDGDHPAAAVVLKNPNDTITSDDIIKYVEERVDDRQRLRGGVKFIKKVPMTATGKVKRGDAQKLFLNKNI